MKADVALEAWLALSLTRGLGGEGARRLLKEFGSPEAVFAASIGSLKPVVNADVAAEIVKGMAAEFEIGFHSSLPCLLGRQAVKEGRALSWDETNLAAKAA